MLLTEVSLCWGQGREKAPAPFILERGVCAYCCPGSPTRRVKNLPLCVPGVLPLSLRLQILETWCGAELCWSSGAGSRHARTDTGLSQRAVTPKHRNTEFGVKHSKEPVSRLATYHLCADGEGWGRVMAPAISFVPGEAMPPSLMCSKKRELSLPVHPRGFSDCTVCSQISALLYWRTAVPSGLHTGHTTDLLKLQSLGLTGCRNS